MSVGDGSELTLQDLGYAAGFIDGEGSIMIKRSKGNRPGRPTPEYRVVVSCANTDKRPLEWLAYKFGGSIKPYVRQTPRHKDTFTWTITAKSAVAFIKLIKPYLIIKHNQAEVAIMFQTSVKNIGGIYKLSQETLAFREDCFQKARVLNKRGA